MTKTILFLDDSAICREPIAAMLRTKGFEVKCAADGRAGLGALAMGIPDLVLLDVAMPRMDGIEFLKQLREMPQGRNIPVILLTATADRDLVLRARGLNAQEYLLKSQFSLEELLTRIRRHLGGEPAPSRAADQPQVQPGAIQERAKEPSAAARFASISAKAAQVHGPTHARGDVVPSEIPKLLDRDATIRRMENYGEAKTLAGVVAEVIQLSSSPRGSIAELAAVLSRDPVLATRVLQVANSAAFASNKPRISTIDEAVRNVGLGTVRKIAATVGIFGAFPPNSADGFNTVRCWQHCFAVAAIMDLFRFDPQVCDAGFAHLVGLCHDLGEIVLRQNYAEEYATCVRLREQTGRPMTEIEQTVFGVRHDELVGILLEKLGLPGTIITPIREYFENRQRATMTNVSPIGQALRLANFYAHGLLLASSADAQVYPFKDGECRSALAGTPPSIDRQGLRAEVITTTNLLARLAPADEARLSRPLLTRTKAKIAYCRHPIFGNFDPLGAALQFLAEVEIRNSLPGSAEELAHLDGIVVATPRPDSSPFSIAEVQNCRRFVSAEGFPLLYLTGAHEAKVPILWPGFVHRCYPVELSALSSLLSAMEAKERDTAAHVAAA